MSATAARSIQLSLVLLLLALFANRSAQGAEPGNIAHGCLVLTLTPNEPATGSQETT